MGMTSAGRPVHLGAMARRRLLEHLELLCTSGAGIGGIAAPACAIVRQLVDGDQAAMFWRDADGKPAGFYHETDRIDLKDLYITRFAELFDGPGQENMLTLTEIEGPAIGRCLPQSYLDRFWAGNIHKHLCVPLDHHYVIDIRVEADGVGRALMMIWHKGQRRFTDADVKALMPAKRLLDIAVAAEQRGRRVRRSSGNAHLITDSTGRTLIAIDAEAEAMLMRSHLLAQNIPMINKPRAAPAFAVALAAMIAAGAPPRFVADAANGRIIADARITRMLDGRGGEADHLYIALTEDVSLAVPCVDHLMRHSLTPLQRTLALFGMQGGDRAECITRFGVSAEALKKHVSRIMTTLGVDRWNGLPAFGEALARR